MQPLRNALLCCAFAGAYVLAACAKSDGDESRQQGPRAAPVELGTVSDGSLTDEWVFLGQIEPALSSEIGAAVAGHVIRIDVREGDRVKAGSTLATLDSARVRAALAASKAKESRVATELELAERQQARIAKLDYPTVSEPEKERFELTVKSLKAELATQRAETKRIQVEYAQHSVKAPFGGTVSARHVDPGAWVNAGQPLLEIVSLDEIEVHVDVSAELGTRLAPGQAATLIGEESVAAEIVGVVPALEKTTRTMRVRLAPEQRPPWLLAGMAIDVKFAVTFEGKGVIVPRDALIRGPVSVRVIKYADGKVVPVKVAVIATASSQALVRGDGLAAGDRVVVRGNERLRPGQPVEIVE